MNRSAIAVWTLAACAVSLVLTPDPVHSQQPDFNKLLVGTWRQQYSVNGVLYVNETTFAIDTSNTRTYIAVTVQPGTPYRFYVQGLWEIRYGNWLYTFPKRWVPGPEQGILQPEWESTWLQVVAANHLRNKAGDMYRIR